MDPGLAGTLKVAALGRWPCDVVLEGAPDMGTMLRRSEYLELRSKL